MKALLSNKRSGYKSQFLLSHLIFSFAVAFLFQLICSKNSPLYPMNDWVDVNCFLTMGKSILNNKIIYLDIYEQKGPLLYFIYAAIAVLSDTSFIGSYLIHGLAMGLFLFNSARIVQLFTENTDWGCLTIPIMALITHTSKSFSHGGSTEELTMWMLAATLYIMARSIKTEVDLKKRECLLIGLFAGFALYVKFTLLGFYLGMALFVLIDHIHTRKFKRLFINIITFLLGILLISIPVFAYFAVHDAIPDFIQAYFYNNICVYDVMFSKTPVGGISRIINIALYVAKSCYPNLVITFLILAGIVALIVKKPFKWQMLLMVLLSGAFLMLTVYWGRCYIYYFLIFSPFAVFSFSWINPRSGQITKPLVTIVTICLLCLSFFLSDNTYLMRYKREDLPQYRFAAQINQIKDATLLNYGFLDGGFYHASRVEPCSKFFCTLNIPLSEMYEEMQALIENGSVDFIVSRTMIEHPNYTCIDMDSFYFEGSDQTYFLYKRIDLV